MKKLCSLLILSFAFTGMAHAFSDITIGDNYYPATTYLEQVGVFKGYEDGTFGRDKLINRAEALKTIFVATETDLSETAPASFNDVPAEAWFAPYIQFALQFNVLKPDGSNNVYPGKELTRGEVASIIFEMLHQGKGLDAQTLLNLTEDHLKVGLEYLERTEVSTAAILMSVAERFSTYTVELMPKNNIVLSANKVVESLKSIVSAYSAGAEGNMNEVVINAKQAWTLADESLQLNAKNEVLTEKLKTIASKLANDARAEGGEG